MAKRKPLLLFIILLVIAAASCRKDPLITDGSAKLEFSTDTLTFDTVFTTVGSTTGYFKIKNTHNRALKVSEINLAGGTHSSFRINVDGVSGYNFKDEEIAANDSIYVFVEVTVDPNNTTNPFVITDSVTFLTNGNKQHVVLEAWGQNAHFFYGTIFKTDQTWNNDLPYVIVHSLLVDSGAALTINQGCRVYMHADSRLFVNYGATLTVNGVKDDEVTFQQDRLEHFFQFKPGQWEGIHLLRGSINNSINYAIIKNPIVGIRVDSLPQNGIDNLTLTNTIIYNAQSTALLGLTAHIHAENCLMFNCNDYVVELELGGNYNFTNCTFYDESSAFVTHDKTVLRMSNYLKVSDSLDLVSDLNAFFTNCIIYGTNDTTEIGLDNLSQVPFNYQFTNCLLRTNTNVPNYVNCILNQSPSFVSPGANDEYNYHLSSSSPCIDAGTNAGVVNDLDGVVRDSAPDIGCYEFTP